MAVHDPPVDFETLVREEMVFQGFPEFLFEPLYHYALIFEGVNITKVVPENSLPQSNKQPILIFNGMLDERVLAHHTDDLLKIAAENASKKCVEQGIYEVRVYVWGPGPGRETAIRRIHETGLRVTLIRDITSFSHNGCRPPKRRWIL